MSRKKGVPIRYAIQGVRIFHRLASPILSIFGMRGNSVVVRQGLRFELDADEAIDFGLLVFRDFEPGLRRAIERTVRSGEVVLDIGANTGIHTLILARQVGPQGCVFAFEPTRFAFAKLRKNLSLNPDLATRVTALEIGLTDVPGHALPDAVSSSWNLSAPLASANPLDMGYAQSTSGAKTLTLDEWSATSNLTRLDWIKLDVDGFEVRVLRGARATLAKWRPKIFLEIAPHHFVRPEETFEQLIELIRDAGYRLHDLNGTAFPTDARSIREGLREGALLNALALPSKD